jgi:hypothetical protein
VGAEITPVCQSIVNSAIKKGLQWKAGNPLEGSSGRREGI